MIHVKRYQAYIELMALSDPPELPHRGYVYTVGRDTSRDSDIIKRELGIAYVEHRRHERGHDISAVISVRRHALRMVKRA